MANVKYCMWPPEKQCVRIKFHHKGQLVTKSVHWYINGVVDERDWNWNVDMLSYMEIDGLVKSLGYASVKCLWYCDPRLSFSHGLRPLNNDNDLLNFVGDVKGFEVVDVYVEHIVEFWFKFWFSL